MLQGVLLSEWLGHCGRSEEMMNCKQGDIALIVRSNSGNEGRVLTCLRLASFAEVRAESLYLWRGPVWVTDAVLSCNDGGTTRLYPDERLKPLRDSDGEDEMLRLAGLPVGAPQEA